MKKRERGRKRKRKCFVEEDGPVTHFVFLSVYTQKKCIASVKGSRVEDLTSKSFYLDSCFIMDGGGGNLSNKDQMDLFT